MNNIILLIKLQIRKLLHDTALTSDGTGGSLKKILISFLLIILLAIITLYSFAIFNQLVEMGAPELSIYLFKFISILAVLYNTMTGSGDFLYSRKANEIVEALPIPISSIVGSKLFCMYIQNLFYCLLLTLPIGIIYGFDLNVSPTFYLQYVMSILTLPIMPILLGVLFINLSLRLNKYLKLLMGIALVFALILFLSSDFLQISPVSLPYLLADMSYYLSFLLIIVVALESDLYTFWQLFFITIVILNIGIVGINWTFYESLELYRYRLKSKEYDLNQYRERSFSVEIMKKEIRAFSRSRVYLLNSIVGLLIMTVGLISLFFFPLRDMLKYELNMLQDIIYYLPFVLSFISMSACPTHCTLSFEGKNFWILKSLPISGTDLINGKIMSYIKFIIPFVLVHVIIVFLNIMSFSELNFIPMLILIPIIYVFFSAVIGVLLDLRFPMFDWTSEEAVVKQKITMPIAMVVNMLSAGVPVGLMIFFPSHRWIIVISSTLLLVIITILLHKILVVKVNSLLVE